MDVYFLATDAAQLIGAVAAAAAVPVALKGLTYIDRWLGIKETDQQRAVMANAVDSVVGLGIAKVQSGAIALKDVHVANPEIDALATLALAQAPAAMAALGITRAQITTKLAGDISHAASTLFPTSEPAPLTLPISGIGTSKAAS